MGEFVSRYGINGHRVKLLGRLLLVLSVFRDAGCETTYVDGSFVANADDPQDIDIVWDVRGVNFGQLGPIFLERHPRINQRTLFSCELFPSDIVESQSGEPFVDFFQTDREGRDKGIVAIDLRGLP